MANDWYSKNEQTHHAMLQQNVREMYSWKRSLPEASVAGNSSSPLPPWKRLRVKKKSVRSSAGKTEGMTSFRSGVWGQVSPGVSDGEQSQRGAAPCITEVDSGGSSKKLRPGGSLGQ